VTIQYQPCRGQHVKVGGLDIGISKPNIRKSPVIHKNKDNVGLGSGRGSRALQYTRERDRASKTTPDILGTCSSSYEN